MNEPLPFSDKYAAGLLYASKARTKFTKLEYSDMIDSQAVSVLGNSSPDADKKHDSKASHQALSSLDIDATTEEGVMTSLQQKDSEIKSLKT